MSGIYAGIGSRETPTELIPVIDEMVQFLNTKNFTLRSGGASGADCYFEKLALKKEIYLPWKGFNNNSSELYTISYEAYDMAKKYHPYYNNLSAGAKKLMARNCYQVLGLDLKTPVDFILCWTKDGKASGGTGQALRIAEDLNIPVFNLKNGLKLQELTDIIAKNENVS